MKSKPEGKPSGQGKGGNLPSDDDKPEHHLRRGIKAMRRNKMEARKILIQQLEKAGLTEGEANQFADIWFRQEEER